MTKTCGAKARSAADAKKKGDAAQAQKPPKHPRAKSASKKPGGPLSRSKAAKTKSRSSSKRTTVQLPGLQEASSSSESDTDCTNPGLILGDEDRPDVDMEEAPGANDQHTPLAPTATPPTTSARGKETPRARGGASTPDETQPGALRDSTIEGEDHRAHDAPDSQPADDKQADADRASSVTEMEVDQGPSRDAKSSPSEDVSNEVDYDESDFEKGLEQGEVNDPNASPKLTEQQRALHPGSPTTPRSKAAVERNAERAKAEPARRIRSTEREPQVITNVCG
uniref:Uncharacterized protein n=1 Tax=Phytophthora ramorum TaxID=164328 RepID=H3H7F0_PHYRM